MLRKAVRHIADAPNELLDERQIAVRDAAFTVAYRLLAVAFTVYVLLYVAHDVLRDLSFDSDRTALGFMSLLISAAMLAGSLAVTPLAALARPAAGEEDSGHELQ